MTHPSASRCRRITTAVLSFDQPKKYTTVRERPTDLSVARRIGAAVIGLNLRRPQAMTATARRSTSPPAATDLREGTSGSAEQHPDTDTGSGSSSPTDTGSDDPEQSPLVVISPGDRPRRTHGFPKTSATTPWSGRRRPVLFAASVAAVLLLPILVLNGAIQHNVDTITPLDVPPPHPDPKDYVSSADKDKAPLSANTFFPSGSVSMGERTYKKGLAGSTTKCSAVTHGDLGPALTGNHCMRVFRATYSNDGVAVTVGIAVFDHASQAAKAVRQTDSGSMVSLPGSGVSPFCNTAICRRTANSYGRYAYFTVAGLTSGKDMPKGDTEVFAAGDDLAEYIFRQIEHRGEIQASQAANED